MCNYVTYNRHLLTLFFTFITVITENSMQPTLLQLTRKVPKVEYKLFKDKDNLRWQPLKLIGMEYFSILLHQINWPNSKLS